MTANPFYASRLSRLKRVAPPTEGVTDPFTPSCPVLRAMPARCRTSPACTISRVQATTATGVTPAIAAATSSRICCGSTNLALCSTLALAPAPARTCVMPWASPACPGTSTAALTPAMRRISRRLKPSTSSGAIRRIGARSCTPLTLVTSPVPRRWRNSCAATGSSSATAQASSSRAASWPCSWEITMIERPDLSRSFTTAYVVHHIMHIVLSARP